ncbi:MAG: hypothetical protein WCT27_01850 [Patescibacteria group bacterium]|jgi:hypothetical protein
MRLVEHCQKVFDLTQGDKIDMPTDSSVARLIEMIREKIDRQVITTNVLRTYAAICYFLQSQESGVTQEQLNQILTYEDQVTKQDVTYCLRRLTDARIIKKRGDYFLLNQT